MDTPQTGFLLLFESPLLAEILGSAPVIVSLIIIEGLLSVDNALAIAAMARHLPKEQQRVALRLGIIGAYFFRGLCMAFAAWIIENPWLKICGAVYLVYLMCKHFETSDGADDSGAVPELWSRSLLGTVFAIEVMDLSLSIDNVVAAVAMSPKLWVVCTGVFIGILALRFVAGACLKLVERYPVLEETAFVLIGYVGLILVFELLSDPRSGFQVLPGPVHVSAMQKFVGIIGILGTAVLYSRNQGLRTVLSPILRALRIPMRAFAFCVGAVLQLVSLPVRLMFRPRKNGP